MAMSLIVSVSETLAWIDCRVQLTPPFKGPRHPEGRALARRLEGSAAGACFHLSRLAALRRAPQDDGCVILDSVTQASNPAACSVITTKVPDIRLQNPDNTVAIITNSKRRRSIRFPRSVLRMMMK